MKEKLIDFKDPITDPAGNHVFKFEICDQGTCLILHSRIKLDKKKVKPVLREIKKIIGIKSDTIDLDLDDMDDLVDPYELLFEKAKLFKWEELIPQIEHVIHKFIKDKILLIKLPPQKKLLKPPKKK
jgi:hypothetical protein